MDEWKWNLDLFEDLPPFYKASILNSSNNVMNEHELHHIQYARQTEHGWN
jgi:hypothetical protein